MARSYGSTYQNRRQAAVDRGSFRVTGVYADGRVLSAKFGKWSESYGRYTSLEADVSCVYALLVMLPDERNGTRRSNLSFARSTPA